MKKEMKWLVLGALLFMHIIMHYKDCIVKQIIFI